QGGFEYALRRDSAHGGLWVLSMRDAAATQDLYEFSEDPQTPWDVEVANHFTSTHPESVFRRTLTIQRTARPERLPLRAHSGAPGWAGAARGVGTRVSGRPDARRAAGPRSAARRRARTLRHPPARRPLRLRLVRRSGLTRRGVRRVRRVRHP